MSPFSSALGWIPAGPGKLAPAAGGPPVEGPKEITCWRCSDGSFWAEESRCPPEKKHVIEQLAVFLATNGYLVAMIHPTPAEIVLLSRHAGLIYEIIPLPPTPKRDWLLLQGK